MIIKLLVVYFYMETTNNSFITPLLRYKIKVGDREKNVPEDSLFATLEEAEARCKELNDEKS